MEVAEPDKKQNWHKSKLINRGITKKKKKRIKLERKKERKKERKGKKKLRKTASRGKFSKSNFNFDLFFLLGGADRCGYFRLCK